MMTVFCHVFDYFSLFFYLLSFGTFKKFPQRFYRAILCVRGICYGPVSVCPFVRLSVCLSQVGVLLKRLNVGLHKQHHTIAQGLPSVIPTVILIVILIIIGIPSPTHSFTLGLNPSFSANPPYRSFSFLFFRFHYMDFPDCLLLLLSISVFLLLSFFCFYTFLVVGSMR